ncbi:MAG: hypothetical protein H7A35_04410 [Planctomycetales bacterium]|nr:hypothetical protein [bacterium]UNM09300.1 MAG: hypothetical protein H7A35_04410 [Planctomycetales bacterium]
MWHTISWVMTILVMLLSVVGLVFRLPSGLQLNSTGLNQRLLAIWITVSRLAIIISASLNAMSLAGSGPRSTDMWSALTYACFIGILIPFRRPKDHVDKVDDTDHVTV